MTLDEWLKKRGLSQSEFARDAGVTQQAVNQLVLGKRMPSLVTAARIYAATNGKVAFWSHLPEDVRRQIWGERGAP